MGGEMFKRRLVRGVAVAIPAQNNFVALLRSFIANVLWSEKPFWKQNLNVCTYVAMRSLVMNLFSHNLLKVEID